MSEADAADLVLVNGRVLTMDRDDRLATSVAVARGVIVAVGDRDEILTLVGPDTRIIDLADRAVTPGLIDTHVHPALAGRRATGQLDLSVATSIHAVADLVSEAVSRRGRGEWITGNGWLESSLRERRFLQRSDLDRVAPHSPVFLTHATGHLGCANTFALRLAGITGRTANPAAGSIERDDAGEPTGILKEPSAMHLVLQHVQQPDVESWRIAVEWAEGVLAAEGVTASKESYDRAECRGILAAYGLLREQNNLRHRPVVLCRPDSATDLGDVAEWQLVTANSATRPGPRPTPRFGGVKLFMDGSLVARTAWMHDPYPSDLGISQQDRGYPAMAPDDFGHLARLANERGLHVAVHAIGDQAIDTVLDVFAKNTAGDGPKTLAPALIHALVPSDTAIARMQMMRISVETQPALLHVLGAGYARALEPQRLRRLLPLRSMINAGLAVSFGSDWPTCAPSPRLGMWAACTRISRALSPDKDVFEPNERINVKEALRAYTSTAASCIGMEEQLGSIELGKFADLVVWEGDILRTSPERLVDLGIRTTIVGGQIVFDAAAE